MIKKFKQFLLHHYIDFFEKEYFSVLNSFRTILCIGLAGAIYLYTKDADLIWLGLCCFFWALHIYTQNQTAFFIKNMFISLSICTLLQIFGFIAHAHILTYCLFGFLIAFLIPYAAYFKQVILYNLPIYFIVQNSVFFEKNIIEKSKSIIYSIVAFFIVIIVGKYIIPINIKKLMMYNLKVNLNYLLEYLNDMQQFILIGTKKNYESLGRQREDLFRALQKFREIYPNYVALHSHDVLSKIAPIQERFIETTIGFCLQIRNIHVLQEDAQKIKDIFKNIHDILLRQRKLIFEVKNLSMPDILLHYQDIFSFAKNLNPISNQNTHMSKKELEEINSAIFQFKESIALMEKDSAVVI